MRFDEAVKSDGGNTITVTLESLDDGTLSMSLDPGKMDSGFDIITAMLMGCHNVFQQGGGDNEAFISFVNQRLEEITGAHKAPH